MFFAGRTDMQLIGLGLSPESVEAFATAATPPPPEPGYAPIGEGGCLQVAKQHRPVPEGRLLGYELLCVDHGLITDSWLCNGLEVYFSERLGIRPNEHGLLGALDGARRCCEAIEKKEVGAEPGLWLPWGLVGY